MTSLDTLLGLTCLGNCLELFLLTSFVIRGRSESESLPDGFNLGWSKIGLSNNGKIDIESGEISKISNLVSLLHGTVKTVTKTFLIEGLLESCLRDNSISFPKVFETNSTSLQKAKIFHLHACIGTTTCGDRHALASE